MSEIGAPRVTYTARGLRRVEIDVTHSQLHRFQTVKGDSDGIVSAKARAKALEWDAMWDKHVARENAARDVSEKKQLAADLTAEALQAIENVNTILTHALSVDDTIDWESLKDHSDYPVPRPEEPIAPPLPEKPQAFREPLETDADFKPKIGPLEWISGSKRRLRVEEANNAFATAHQNWVLWMAENERQHQLNLQQHATALQQAQEAHRAAVETWEHDAAEYKQRQLTANEAVDQNRDAYLRGDLDAVTSYCTMVLENSTYPECFPKSFELEYNPVNRIVIVDYQLPAPSDLPSLIEVKYVAARDELTEKTMSQSQLNQVYDAALYQVALRTAHELFESDALGALDAVVFNGWVRSIDPSTGKLTEPCVITLQVARDEFLSLDLANVDPKACFKKLKGVGAARLHSLTAVAPLLAMSREDRRFVASREVVDALNEGDNLAAMDWEDFEHLIRELFEQEFSEAGAEVKVTQASRDGGVDAVIFNPDPLHGGKTVVQAKRYTNTVGVSAVRDLYGTMMNEGANKGILVTTSDYGPDAYEFAKGKPLVLLNGGNLLHLLERHGHKARINLQEAKLFLGENGS